MPVFYQQQMNDDTRIGIWKIEETEDFFKGNVPVHRDVTHPHKRLQHLAGRFLLQYLYPDFPDTRKPFLPGEQYHFSISHCGDYAAAIVSPTRRVGIDVEEPTERIFRVANRFLSNSEWSMVNGEWSMVNGGALSLSKGEWRCPEPVEGSIVNSEGAQPKHETQNPKLVTHNPELLTLLWSAKESVFKWYGAGSVDFKNDIQLNGLDQENREIDCFFVKANAELKIGYEFLDGLVCSWVIY